MKTIVAGIPFASFVLNASGPNDSTLEELETIGRSGSAGIMMKSCTIEPRKGNEEPRYSRLPFGSIQSMGLPNLGYKEYIKFATNLKRFHKPVIASVAGLCTDDYVTMVRAFQASDVDLIEVNLSCPNIVGKPQVGYDFAKSAEVLDRIEGLGQKPIGLKLPPYFDEAHQKEMSRIILSHHISFLTCINSVGNTLVINPETESPIIIPKHGYGGLSGSYIKPIALANVNAFYRLLGRKVSLFGCGGISSGTDAFEFLLAGADAVHVGTVFEKEGASCFSRIDDELNLILKKKGYASINEAKGKLKN